jgi:hypothetical protein
MHRPLHFVVLLSDTEDLGLHSRSNVFAGKGVIRPGVTGEAGNECAGEEAGKEMLHGFLYPVSEPMRELDLSKLEAPNIMRSQNKKPGYLPESC